MENYMALSHLCLPEDKLRLIYKIRKIIADNIECDAYLFGSYAKRMYKATSDIDIVCVVDDSYTLVECRRIKNMIEDSLYELDIFVEVDMKFYRESDFKLAMSTPLTFLDSIKQDLKELKLC